MIRVQLQIKLMGNVFDFVVISETQNQGEEQIQEAIREIQRIEQLLTTYSEDSLTSLVNRNAGIFAVQVTDEFFGLVSRAQKISELTQCLFDLSYGSLDTNFWNFNTQMDRLPDKHRAKQAVRLIDYHNIVLNSSQKTVFLRNKGMRIGFGGIGKGYAADAAKRVLLECGVKNGIVSASGDLNAWGFQEDGAPWTIGIANPNFKNSYFSTLNITNKSVATSGNYEKYVIIDKQIYSHTINPRTGYPVKGLKSVTIITSNAELADAMATPISIMGAQQGVSFLNQIDGIECILIDDDDRLYVTKNITLKQ